MGYRHVPFVENEYYHIYNRGNSKQVIFREPADYERFQALLYFSNSHNQFVFREIEQKDYFFLERGELLVRIEAYCLMPNHFHILLTPLVDEGVSLFMKKLSTGYSMFFNKKYERTGSLFEGRFKSQHAVSDEYLKYLYSYINLNPLKLYQSSWREEGIRDIRSAFKYLETYSYSSYPDLTIGPTYVERREKNIVDQLLFKQYFSTKTFKKEMLDWIDYKPSIEISP